MTVSSQETPRLDVAAALGVAAEEAARITGAEGVAIAIGNAGTMSCCTSLGNAPEVGVLLGPDSGLSGICLRTAEVVQCDDTASDARVDPVASRRMNLRSLLIVPVVVDGVLHGILEVVSSKPHAFDATHREHLSSIAQGIAALLSHAGTVQARENADAATASTPAGNSASVAAAVREPERASSFAAVEAEEELLPAPPPWSPATTTGKAGIGIAVALLLALGWYAIGGQKASTPVPAPTTKAETPATGSQPTGEVTVEQSSLSVAGLDEKASGASAITPGQLLHKVEPLYPASARAQGVGGAVVLTALITKQGKIANVQLVRGPQALAAPAIDAVRQWVYEPYRQGGKPVEVETTIIVRFTPHP